MGDQLQRFPTQSSGQRKPFVLQTVEADDQCALQSCCCGSSPGAPAFPGGVMFVEMLMMGMVAGCFVGWGCVESHAALGLWSLQLSHMPYAVAVKAADGTWTIPSRTWFWLARWLELSACSGQNPACGADWPCGASQSMRT